MNGDSVLLKVSEQSRSTKVECFVHFCTLDEVRDIREWTERIYTPDPTYAHENGVTQINQNIELIIKSLKK